MTSMLLPLKDKEFELVPADIHLATCYRVIDLGTQQIEWQGQVKRQPKIMLSWELPDALMSDGKPFSIHQRYTYSSSEKSNLRKDLESWRGVAFKDEDLGKFDISVLIGKSCLMGVVQETSNGKTYANISSIIRLPKGWESKPFVNESVVFSLGDFDQATYDKLSDSLKAVIAKSPEYQELKGAHKAEGSVPDDGRFAPVDASPSDEIPF
jgi:hypothetical protein